MSFKFGIDNDVPIYKVKNKIRLIELFAGVGTQAMALRDIGANFERYRVVEFDKSAINSYNAIHGTNFEPTDIRNIKGKDLGIVDKDNYEYLMFYSFPCTDLSSAGKEKGMSKGSGTRSGLLWEVERLLDECVDSAVKENKDKSTYLPQILIMENVSQVHNNKNSKDWKMWLDKLESIGYTNSYKDLNGRDFNVPQNRLRCFMVSILGNYTYEFPQPPGLKKSLSDVLETDVDEKFFVSNEKRIQLLTDLKSRGLIIEDFYANRPVRIYDKTAPTLRAARHGLKTICASRGRNLENPSDRTRKKEGSIWIQRLEPNVQGISNTLTTVCKDNMLLSNEYGDYDIRNLTPKEYWRLMSYSDEDYEKAAAVSSQTQLYKQAGNAIIEEVLKAIFKKLF